MNENEKNGLMPEPESDLIVPPPPTPLNPGEETKISGGKKVDKGTAKIGGEDSTKKDNHFWDKFKKHSGGTKKI
ncbi:MAG: hypothetical protein Q4D57_03065 [Clostridia bacterium]|nr:hypothetical protein [Clostridia bacterium]